MEIIEISSSSWESLLNFNKTNFDFDNAIIISTIRKRSQILSSLELVKTVNIGIGCGAVQDLFVAIFHKLRIFGILHGGSRICVLKASDIWLMAVAQIRG